MELTRYAGAADFLKHARAPLEVDEAENGLMVGIAARVAETPGFYRYPVYFGTVDSDNHLLAAAIRTPPFNVIAFRAKGVGDGPLGLLLDDILEFTQQQSQGHEAPNIPGVTARRDTAQAFAVAWRQRTGKSFHIRMAQRIYELRRVTLPVRAPGALRPARDDEEGLLTDWVYRFNTDCHLPALTLAEAGEVARRQLDQGSVFFWDDRMRPVSMAARGRNTSHGITVSLVYTPPEVRGRGYASACVAALSQQLLDAGWEFCMLYTDLANPTSNDIYQKIGYVPVCDSTEYEFDQTERHPVEADRKERS